MSEENYIVRGVPAQFVSKFWHFALPYIKRALDHSHGEMKAQDFMEGCANREMQLWLIYREGRVVGAGTTQIINYPQKKVCRIITLAGSEFDQWKQIAHNLIEMWAVENQCVGVEAFTRKGFIPKLQDMGYRHKYAVAYKALMVE